LGKTIARLTGVQLTFSRFAQIIGLRAVSHRGLSEDDMDNLFAGQGGSRSAFKGLAWLAGALATLAALTIGAALAVVATVTVVIIALMSSALLGLAVLANRARRTVRAKAQPAEPGIIEARNVGGHSWVAYGWNERR
jgi:hypothetical protein